MDLGGEVEQRHSVVCSMYVHGGCLGRPTEWIRHP